MQELMSRHKTYNLSPRDCLKTCLFQKWQRMVAPPGMFVFQHLIYFIIKCIWKQWEILVQIYLQRKIIRINTVPKLSLKIILILHDFSLMQYNVKQVLQMCTFKWIHCAQDIIQFKNTCRQNTKCLLAPLEFIVCVIQLPAVTLKLQLQFIINCL